MVIAGRPPPDSGPSLSWETLPPSRPSHLGNPSCSPPACPAQHAGRWFLLQLLDCSCVAEPWDSRTVALPASSSLSTAPSLLLPHSRRNRSAGDGAHCQQWHDGSDSSLLRTRNFNTSSACTRELGSSSNTHGAKLSRYFSVGEVFTPTIRFNL